MHFRSYSCNPQKSQSTSFQGKSSQLNEITETIISLDITAHVCPMTFVRTKLAVERLEAGQALDVRLNAGEPLVNVPRSLAEHGYGVEMLGPEEPDGTVHRIRVRRPPAG